MLMFAACRIHDSGSPHAPSLSGGPCKSQVNPQVCPQSFSLLAPFHLLFGLTFSPGAEDRPKVAVEFYEDDFCLILMPAVQIVALWL